MVRAEDVITVVAGINTVVVIIAAAGSITVVVIIVVVGSITVVVIIMVVGIITVVVIIMVVGIITAAAAITAAVIIMAGIMVPAITMVPAMAIGGDRGGVTTRVTIQATTRATIQATIQATTRATTLITIHPTTPTRRPQAKCLHPLRLTLSGGRKSPGRSPHLLTSSTTARNQRLITLMSRNVRAAGRLRLLSLEGSAMRNRVSRIRIDSVLRVPGRTDCIFAG